MFHLSDFISSPLDPTLQASLEQLPFFPQQLRHCLISGPERCGKTSILLHYAYSVAATGRPVLFICERSKMEQVPPLLPPCVDRGDPAFDNIHMRYLTSLQELQQYAACMHMLEDFPQAIVVDDLSAFIDARRQASTDRRQRDADMARVLAFLHEATTFASRKLEEAEGEPCRLLVSDLASDGPQGLYMYQRWLPLMLAIRGSGPEYVLSVMPQSVKASAMPAHCASQLHYSLTPHTAITLTAVQPMLLVE